MSFSVNLTIALLLFHSKSHAKEGTRESCRTLVRQVGEWQMEIYPLKLQVLSNLHNKYDSALLHSSRQWLKVRQQIVYCPNGSRILEPKSLFTIICGEVETLTLKLGLDISG